MRVYNDQLEYIYRLRDFQALNVTRKYTGTGTARLTLAAGDAAAYYLQKNHFLVIDDEPYVVKHIEQGLERVLIQAYSCHALLDQRLTGKGAMKNEQIVSVGSADAVVKDFINRSKGDLPITTKPDQGDPKTVKDVTRLKKLGEEVKRVLDIEGRGERFSIEDNTLYFDTYKGEDKSLEVIFSAELGNLDEMVYTETSVDDQTTIYIGGAGEGAGREMAVVGDEAEGLARIEVFSDARDVDEGDTEELINRAEQLLTSTEKAITATLMQGDYKLGDEVTIRFIRPVLDGNTAEDKTLDLKLRITQETISRQDGEEHVDLQFGTIPLIDSDPIKELRKKMAQMETAETPIERITEQVKGDIEETLIGEVEDLNEFANALMGLYTTKVTLPDNSEIIYSHDEEQLEDSAFIATKHAGAIAWTTTGWNDGHPAWQYGVDQTGNAIFRLVSTVGLNANWINAGKVKAQYLEIGPGADFTAGYDPSDKRRVFTSQPTPPYDVGDLWVEGSAGDIKKCKTAKAAGGAYSAADWELASKYTDDTAVGNLSGSLKAMAFEDLVELAKLGTTIIDGAYLKTSLIKIDGSTSFATGYNPATKRRVFTAQPVPPYDIGDLWAQGSTGDIRKCKTAKAEGASYSITDWELASKYTDDTTVNTLAGNLKDLAYEDLVELAMLGDSIIAGGYIKTELLDATAINTQIIQIGSGTSFATGYDPSAKNRIFSSTPTTPYYVGDLWTQGSTGDIRRCKTTRTSGSYQATDWEIASKYTDDTAVNSLSGSLGDLAYDDLVELAMLGDSIIAGGYIKTELIQIGEDAAFEEGYDPTKTKYANRNYLLKSNITRTRVSGGRYVGNWVPSVPMVAGKTYTMTVKAKLGAGTTGLRIYVSQNYSQLGRIDFSGTDIEVASLTFTCSYYSGRTPQDNIANADVSLWIYPDDASNPNDTVVYWVKLEEGDKSTEWVLAPEDDLLADVSYKGVMINKDDGFVSTATIGGKTALVKMNSTDGIVIVYDGVKTFGVDTDGATYVTKLLNPADPNSYLVLGDDPGQAGAQVLTLYGPSAGGGNGKKLIISNYYNTALDIRGIVNAYGSKEGTSFMSMSHGEAMAFFWDDYASFGAGIPPGGASGRIAELVASKNNGVSINYTTGALGVDNTGPYLAIDNTKTYFADAPQTLTLTANWSHQSYSTYGSFIAQLINPNAVMLNGTIKSSVANDSGAITTLPEKYRPNKRKLIPVSKLGDASTLYILSIATSGVISLYNPTYSANNIVAIHGVVYNINEPD